MRCGIYSGMSLFFEGTLARASWGCSSRWFWLSEGGWQWVPEAVGGREYTAVRGRGARDGSLGGGG